MPSTVSNSLIWIFESFERDATNMRRRMFGCDAAYVDGLLCLVAADREKPFDGLLVCTAREQHAALMEEMPALRPHTVLGKWLYIAQDHAKFEPVAQKLVLARDARICVEPKLRKKGKKALLPKG